MTDELEQMLRSTPTDEGAVTAALQRFAERAVAEGAADLTYATLDSPVGALVVIASERGLVRLSYGEPEDTGVLDDVAQRLTPRIVRSPVRTDEVRRQLDAYFDGARREFDLPLDWSLVRGFTWRVLRACADIPFGEVSTYREMATRAGNERAVRAAGNALGHNPIPIVVPCHRVLRTGGSLGGYTGGLEIKRKLLDIEGIETSAS
jgi:methylated-DNA-[protein]-cysteine S-methyltransferase